MKRGLGSAGSVDRAAVARLRATLLAAALPALLAGLAAGCGGRPEEARVEATPAPEAAAVPAPVEVGPEPIADAPPVGYAIADESVQHRPMRFADDQVSLNDKCPVRKRGLNLRLLPVYVNGAPIGFC